jgi:hypothetical protein
MLWCENEKVDRKMENIDSLLNIFIISGGVTSFGQKICISFSNALI